MISSGIARNRNAENWISILAHRRSKLTSGISFQEIRTASVHVSRVVIKHANRRHASRKYATIEIRILRIPISSNSTDLARIKYIFTLSRFHVGEKDNRVSIRDRREIRTTWLSRIRIVSRSIYQQRSCPNVVRKCNVSSDELRHRVGKETRIILIWSNGSYAN